MALLAEVLVLAENQIAVNGQCAHLADHPERQSGVGSFDGARAGHAAMLEDDGIARRGSARITGHADRKPATQDPTAVRNNRLEVILLRTDR